MEALRKLCVWVSAVTLSLGVAGCVADAQFTKADNPLAELTPRAPRAGRVCVFFNENSRTSFDVMGDLHAALRREGIQSDADPRRRAAELTAALTTRFESAQVIDSLEQVGVQKCDFALAMDIQVRLGPMSFATTTVEMVGAFADSRGRQIESLTGSGRAPVPFPANSSHIPAA